MKHRLRFERITQAAVGGPLVGGLLVGVWFLHKSFLGSTPNHFSVEYVFALVFLTLLAIAIAFFAFLMGVLIVGLPLWVVLHRLGRTEPLSAAGVGGVATAIGVWAIGSFSNSDLVWLGLDGAVVGWAVQRIAYKPFQDSE